jgi:hypothetical protein
MPDSVASDHSRNPSGDVRITLRLPADLHTALRDLARHDDRSLNREIVALLRQAAFPTAAADAYQDSRRSLLRLPRYSFPRPTNRRPKGGG